MTPPIQPAAFGLRAVELAAGKDAGTSNGRPLILEPLSERSVLECVMRNALQIVPAERTYIVVGYSEEDVRRHLGSGYRYVVQNDLLGTAHAVLQVAPFLEDFHGDLLILYGDTPLFRPDTIRGLVNRHRLKRSHLTLLTARLDRHCRMGESSAATPDGFWRSSRRTRRRPTCAKFGSETSVPTLWMWTRSFLRSAVSNDRPGTANTA
jgi:hypothetical protein